MTHYNHTLVTEMETMKKTEGTRFIPALIRGSLQSSLVGHSLYLEYFPGACH
jgi:hypothetical protein